VRSFLHTSQVRIAYRDRVAGLLLSEWEKPESLAPEDLCAVRSSKAKRLTPIKAGYYTPRGRPIFVAGMHWLALRVALAR
jgi:hypothetical protein